MPLQDRNGIHDEVSRTDYENLSGDPVGRLMNRFAPDGDSVGTSMMMWVDTPHFYKAGRIIVLYIGSDQTILDLLVQTIGTQFAGR